MKQDILGDENIFARFEFPVLAYSKTQMRDLANTHGFRAILEQSWFCHQSRTGIPCGICNPCVYTIEEGMGYRLPQEALLRYHAPPLQNGLQSSVSVRETIAFKSETATTSRGRLTNMERYSFRLDF